MKTSNITEPPVQDQYVTQIGNCFQDFGDTLRRPFLTVYCVQ